MFSSLLAGINIAAASQLPLARRLLSSYLPLLLPCCLKEQSTNAACTSKIFTHLVLAAHKGHSLSASDVRHSNKPCTHMHMLTCTCSGPLLPPSLSLSRHRARPHTHTHTLRGFFLPFPELSILFMPCYCSLKSWWGKTS